MAAAAATAERPADDVADDGFVEADLSKDDVVSKYRQAADITNAAIQAVLKRCVAGADVLELCILGDRLIDAQVSTKRRRTDGI
jgi:methionine aminopeptidase